MKMGMSGALPLHTTDKRIAQVTVDLPDKCLRKWKIHGERISALTDFLDWAEKQRLLEEKKTEIARRFRAKKASKK